MFFQSGNIFSPWAFHDDISQQREFSFRLGNELGCSASNSDELLQCLRHADALELQQKAASVSEKMYTLYLV